MLSVMQNVSHKGASREDLYHPLRFVRFGSRRCDVVAARRHARRSRDFGSGRTLRSCEVSQCYEVFLGTI